MVLYKVPLSILPVLSVQRSVLCYTFHGTGIMDISTAVFVYGSFVVARVDQGNEHDSATEGPDDPGKDDDAGDIFRHSIGDTYVRGRQFRAPQVLTHLSHIDSKGSMLAYAQSIMLANLRHTFWTSEAYPFSPATKSRATYSRSS